MCSSQVLDVCPRDGSQQQTPQLELDPEWLCILRSTNHLLRLTKAPTFMPGPGAQERYGTTDNLLATFAQSARLSIVFVA